MGVSMVNIWIEKDEMLNNTSADRQRYKYNVTVNAVESRMRVPAMRALALYADLSCLT